MDLLILCLATALLLVSYLAWQSRQEVVQLKNDRNLAIAVGKNAYATGHEDGLADAYRRAHFEMESASRKAGAAFDLGYKAGWEAAAEQAARADELETAEGLARKVIAAA